MSTRTTAGALVVVLAVLAGCGAADDAASTADAADGVGAVDPSGCGTTAAADHPDVVAVAVEDADGDGRYDVAATLCSAYDTPERYADAWRVRTPEGEVLAVRELLHDHAAEQPFTRSLPAPLEVPDAVTELVVEGRDLVNGWGGATVRVRVP